MESYYCNYFLWNKRFILGFVFVLIALCVAKRVEAQGTSVGFYLRSCPEAEFIVRSTVEFHVRSNPNLAAKLLRMHFHDCFVRGCDASILIDGPGTERKAPPNVNLAGFEVIDDAKAKLEAACPGVVSCADILALAARDSVALSGGLSWEVPTGRRDGRISIGSETSALVSPNDTIAIQKQKLANQGLNTQNLVILVGGGHSIGSTACQFVAERIYSNIDSSIDPSFVPYLREMCPQNQPKKRVALDSGSQFHFDTSYLYNLLRGHGILRSDQLLWTDPSTSAFVRSYLAPPPFYMDFANSMVKMANNAVKTGFQGEIRKKCYAVN